MNNTEFLLAIGKGHPGRFWVTGFSGDPGQANGSSWRGHLVHRSTEIPNGDTNSYFSVGMLQDDATSRTKAACTAVVAVVLDDVASDDLPEEPAPTWILETSPHNHQVGFALVPGQPQEAVDGLIRGLIRAGHCAADQSGNNLVRYVRLPNGINAKQSVIIDYGGPFPCRLDEFEPSRRYTVEQLAQAFAVEPEAAVDASNHLPDEELVRQIVTCEAFHTPLVQLAARLVGRGTNPEDVVAQLQGLMNQASDHLSTTKRREEWQQRLDAIPRYAQSAAEKFKDPLATLKVAGPAMQWPDVEPLGVGYTEPLPFPTQDLPAVIRDAVQAYAAYGQQPLAMIASSALATVSLVCQGHADVARDERLRGPISLFLLPVGVSGERKTAVDKMFTAPLRRAVNERQQVAAEEIAKAKSRHRSWSAQMRGVERALAGLEEGKLPSVDKPKGGAAVTSELIEEARRRLMSRAEELAREEPVVPSPPKLFFSDTTIEGLAEKMQRGLPIGALWEDEGGVTLGSVGLKEDRLLGFVTSFSKLWDATGWTQDRASVEDRDMSGKRVTVNLMMQPDVLAGVAGLQRGTARTTGFLARFLICEPQSTMGSRMYAAPRDMAAVDRLTARTLTLFNKPLPTAEGTDFTLDPPLLQLDPQAFELWRRYHDEVESELAQDGDLIDIPDYASKSAEQACRIAACFHLFTGRDIDELIDADTMQQGIAVAQWFLLETLRVMSVRTEPERIADARHLWEWAQDRPSFTGSEVARCGPNRLRKAKDRRDRALNVLVEHGYLRLESRGNNARTYHINPNVEGSHGDAR